MQIPRIFRKVPRAISVKSHFTQWSLGIDPFEFLSGESLFLSLVVSLFLGWPVCVIFVLLNQLWEIVAARSLEDENRNGERNTNQIPECWGDFSQVFKIKKLKFPGISRYNSN